MSEDKSDYDRVEPPTAFDPVCGWLKLWHKRGVQVTIPLRGAIDTFAAQVDMLFDVGWLSQCPGMEEGEEKEDIGWVCRIDHESERGVTPTVLLYSATEQLTYSYLRKYLNTADDIKDFEFSCKVRLNDLPIYPGNDHPQRGKSPKTDKFIIALGKPTTMIWKHNPRFKDAPAPPANDSRTASEKTKRMFVRWADQKAAAEAPPQAEERPDMKIVSAWTAWLASGEATPEAINDRLPELSKLGAMTKAAIWNPIKAGFTKDGWTFSPATRRFVAPNNSEFAEAGF